MIEVKISPKAQEILVKHKDLGSFLRDKRKENNWTQEQVGELAEVSKQMVSQWERNQNPPNTKRQKALSKLLGVPFLVFSILVSRTRYPE